MANLIDYAVLITITMICVYIIYRMIKKRQASNPATAPVPYSDIATPAQTVQLNKIENTSLGSGITNLSLDPSQDNSLRNFCIKSSFNSAYTGSYVNQNMVKYVLSRGCRFLDFEVFIKDGVPIVAYSDAQYDPSYSSFTSLAPALSLAGVCSTIMSNAFTDTSPNPGDPLFIQLHINTNLSSSYSVIAETIISSMSNKLYVGNVTPSTPLNLLMGQIVLIIDNQTANSSYQNYSGCAPNDNTCYNLKTIANMASGSNQVMLYKQYNLMQQATNPPDPDVYLFRIVLPNSGIFYGVNNSDMLYLVKNYGAQVVAQAFYVNDNNLAVYEAMFRQYKRAFVPLAAAIAYSV